MTPATGRARGERGAAATEFALLVPSLILIAGLLVGGGRVWFARATVAQLAQSAARGTWVARDANTATATARAAARLQAESSGLRCEPLEVRTDAAGFAIPVGRPASVTVTVDCLVPLGDVLVPGWPGSLPLTASAESVLDRYRERR